MKSVSASSAIPLRRLPAQRGRWCDGERGMEGAHEGSCNVEVTDPCRPHCPIPLIAQRPPVRCHHAAARLLHSCSRTCAAQRP